MRLPIHGTASAALLSIGQNRRQQAERCRTAGTLDVAVCRDRRQLIVHGNTGCTSVEPLDGWGNQRMFDAAGDDCAKRLVEAHASWRLPISLTIADLDEKRPLGLQDETIKPTGNACLRGIGNRPHRPNTEFFPDLGRRIEDRRARQAPVDLICHDRPRKLTSGDNFSIIGRTVRLLRPNNWLAVETHDDEEALADRRGTVIASTDLAAFHFRAELAQLLAPFLVGLAFALRIGPQTLVGLNQRAVVLKLLDILHDDDIDLAAALLDALNPAGNDPTQVANVSFDRLPALRLAEMLAVGREPGEANMLAAQMVQRVDLVDVFREVDGLRMVCLMERQSRCIVVDGVVRRPAECLLNTSRGAAAACKAVDDIRTIRTQCGHRDRVAKIKEISRVSVHAAPPSGAPA